MEKNAIPLVLLLGCLFFAASVNAQTGTSSIRGTVVDPQGGAVAGATVTLSNEARSLVRTTTTNEAGVFAFDLVQPGAYQIEVEAAGFKKTTVRDVRALVAQPTEINIQLEVGQITEAVTVSAANELTLNTQDASLGNNFVSLQIIQLPLEARNPISLLTLQPGVTPSGNVTGARSDQSNITLDGVDINEAQTNSIFNPVLRLNGEAVEEFRVVTSNANASYGRSSGAQISLITRSGTNQFHGALFEYHRNTVTTANDFFNNRSGLPRPKLLRNTFGGRLDGPIIKDRLFFLYSYEGRRDASETVVGPRVVPLASLGRGEVKFLGAAPGDPPGTVRVITLTPDQLAAFFPQVGLNPRALAVLADAARRYPANDLQAAGDGLNTAGFRFNAPTRVRFNSHVARLDFNLTSKHTLFFRGSYQHDTRPLRFANPQRFPDTPVVRRWYHPYGFAIGHTWAISGTKTNNLRYGLTRLALSDQGDSDQNAITFRFVFAPRLFVRTFNRVNPVHNITDDFSWIIGNHTLQLGTNVRIIRNRRLDFGAAYDNAVTNPFFYQASGNVLLTPIRNAGYTIAGNPDDLKAALTAVIGRFSQYTANFNFDLQGKPLPAGQGVFREFATEEYDFYAQDVWKVRSNLTLTYGLRYGLSRPVYETQGYIAVPDVPLGEYLRRRIESAGRGINYVDPIRVNLGERFYNWDKNNFQPRVSIAWSPNFKSGLFGLIFGGEDKSVIRAGFAITNDYFGQQLAVTFNAQNQLGFSSAQTISANTFNVTTRPAPLFTGFDQSIRTLPGIVIPSQLTFPQQRPADNRRRIESSLDSNLVSPINYSWNLSFQRQLPAGVVIEMAYVGRAARNLLAGRDAVQPNLNFTDQKSGQTWTQAATILEILRANNTPIASVQPLPFFENLYAPGSLGQILFGVSTLTNTQAVYAIAAATAPGCANIGCYEFGNDWASVQDLLDGVSGRRYFYQPQYGALAVYSTIASSDYHAGTLSIRQRFRNSLSFDFNYTLSKSMDDVSGLQTDAPFTPFILNALDLKQQRSVSDFDIRHIINANAIWQLPIGRGRALLSNISKFADAFIGGWQLSGIFRWNSGLPVDAPLDFGGWPTNWNRRNYTVRIRPLKAEPNRGGATPPNLFSDPQAAYRSFRSGRPGERGDRNILRYPGYVVLDMGLAKSFTMPWSEGHRLQFRWEVFNVTNTQRLTAVDGWVQGLDPFNSSKNPTFGNLTAIQGTPRVMQFGLRYSF